MLSFIRKGLSSFVVTMLLGLLVVSFAIWGIGDAFRFNAGNALVSVGDSKVTPTDFVREFHNALNGYRQQSGADISVTQAKELGLPQQVLEQMVSRVAFDQAAKNLKLSASDSQVYDLVHAIPAFQNSFKEFDKGLYENVLHQNGLTPRQFEDMARSDIPRDQLLRSVGMSAHMPAELARRLYAYHGEERTIDFLQFQASGVTNVKEPTEAEIAASYKASEDKYMAPEYRGLSYIVLDANKLMQQVSLTDADLKAYFDNHPEQYSKPEQRDLSQMVIADKAKAEAAAADLKAGKDFAAVAQSVAQMSSEDTALGTLTKSALEGSLGKPVADAVFALPVGGTTAPIESSFGWHILKVNSLKPGETTPFDTVRTSVEADVRKEKALDQLYQITSRIEDDIASGMTLPELAKKLDLPLEKVSAVDAQGFAQDGSRAALPELKGFLEKAFTTEAGADIELQEADPSHYFLLAVDNVTPKTLRPLASVRTAVIENWKDSERAKAAQATAEAAKQALAAGKSFDDVKATANGGGQQNIPVARLPKPGSANLPPELKNAAFSIPVGSSVIVPSPDKNGVVLIHVTVVKPGSPDADAEIFSEVQNGLQVQYGNDALVAYRAYLQRTLGTKYNEQLFKDTVDQINR
ncbi:SurA N-terminal domain-containing protein [Govanella unica]|uniref:Parvulin-like PPIase n=1 Tax=Govanella unica TaxID=2975056 RepID=A0A9X3TYB9_9PROT|nr:SurA N-terminal domain-containing protein [Govania unica]MDA5193794.1 SurA N-terminal domain-containing protein [Govania unica]